MSPKDADERVSLSVDPEEALRALLKVDPESEPVEHPAQTRGSSKSDEPKKRDA